MTYLLTAIYLIAIVAANLTVTLFGPSVVIINAFLFIGLDLTARDRLHDAWRGQGLVWKMGLLIAAGGLLSYLINQDAGRIAAASTIAFTAAALTDAGIYHLLRRRPFLVRVNGSNIPGAAVDSIVFPTLAFGVFLPWIILGQFAAKVAGGFMWSLILNKRGKRVAASS
jgi:uncharacterized PurR-regulated membrane protein YhhQ (DUF165 family)